MGIVMRKKELSGMFRSKGAALWKKLSWKTTLALLWMWTHLWVEECLQQAS